MLSQIALRGMHIKFCLVIWEILLQFTCFQLPKNLYGTQAKHSSSSYCFVLIQRNRPCPGFLAEREEHICKGLMPYMQRGSGTVAVSYTHLTLPTSDLV